MSVPPEGNLSSPSPSVFFCLQTSSTYARSKVVDWFGGAQVHSHLICKGQKVVVDQDRCRCMIIMLRARVKRDSPSTTTNGYNKYLESKPRQLVISDELDAAEENRRTSPSPSGISGQPGWGPS
jgi:hypothetical protein